MPKGNRQPVNNIVIHATSELLDLINSLPNPKGLPHFQIVTRDFVKAHKKEFIAMHGKEAYDEHMRKYNRNRVEMTRDKVKREEAIQKHSEEILRLKREELKIKKRELNVQEQKVGLRKEKLEGDNPSEIKTLINIITTSKGIARHTALNRLREIDPEKASELMNNEQDKD